MDGKKSLRLQARVRVSNANHNVKDTAMSVSSLSYVFFFYSENMHTQIDYRNCLIYFFSLNFKVIFCLCMEL